MDESRHRTNFPTVFGRNLVGELRDFVRPPFLVVTMEDLWPMFEHHFEGADCRKLLVRSMEVEDLDRDVAANGDVAAVVGIGGGQALDAAKWFAWKLGIQLFQVPTALSMNAFFGQRAGVRVGRKVIYRGWAVPQAVYFDYDVLRGAPKEMNHSGIGDVLCFHTGVLDWRYADRMGKCEAKWPYDEELAAMSLKRVDDLLDNLGEVRDLTDKGLMTLVRGLEWGTSYHTSGWNPRHIEGIDHFVFYSLEKLTGVKFLHGPPVCLGIVVGSLLHESRAEEMLSAMATVGVDIRPESMGITWEHVEEVLVNLRTFVRESGLWYGIAHDAEIKPGFVRDLRDMVEAAYESGGADT